MNILLLAFALPVAIIILSVVLQRILKSPLLVASTFFAILLVVTYAFYDSSFLLFTILYTILSYVTAVLARLICKIIQKFQLNCNNYANNQIQNSNYINDINTSPELVITDNKTENNKVNCKNYRHINRL